MFASLFKKPTLLPEEAIQWLFDGFAWALQEFGSENFYQQTVLVEPSNKFFPGQGETVEEMAKLICDRVRHYAGLENWPCQVVNHHDFDGEAEALPGIRQVMQERHDGQPSTLTLFYEPQQVGNPNAMIANYAHGLAYQLATLAHSPAPCEPEQWPHMAELLAVYMGFGVMLVNTARPERVTCGSCRSPAMDRVGALEEMEVTYALAIFCALKEIPAKQVCPLVKSYLRPLLKKAIKDVQTRSEQLGRLKAIHTQTQLRGLELKPI